jgi:hypothetical protein
MNKPNFIIAGVARCGTTSLYHYLRQHPQIGFPKIKEPKYFSSIHLDLPHKGPGDNTVDAKLITDESKYFELFDSLENFKAIGEASSDYFYYNENTIPAIKEKLGDVKIILCFRNPIERSYSAYNNLVRDGREELSFDKAIDEEENRISQNWDWMWAYKAGGLYTEGLKAFLANFSQVKVVFSDELDENPQKVLVSIFEFLEVDKIQSVDSETRYSHSGKPKNAFIGALTNRNNKIIYGLREFALKTIPRKYLEKVASKMFAKDQIDPQTRQKLQEYFKEDINELEKITQTNLKNWK